MKNKLTLTRAEVNRRLDFLKVDPWRHLSACIDRIFVNAWTSGRTRRVDRISVDVCPGANAQHGLNMARDFHRRTGLTTHFHFHSGCIVLAGDNSWKDTREHNKPFRSNPNRFLP